MAKFDMTQWCDFVRGVARPDIEKQMREYLAREEVFMGSRKSVDLLYQVAEVGRLDDELEIPEYAVRCAKAIGSLQRRPAEPSESGFLRSLPFKVTFDSLLQPAPAGTRNLQSSHRQVVYQADRYTVDVRMEHEANPRSAVVVGQLLRHAGEVRPVPHVPVLVLSDHQIVGRALTSRFGEFQAESLPQNDLHLCLLVEPEACLRLPLAAVGSEPQDPRPS